VLLRRPNKGEDRADDRLAPNEARVLRFQDPAGARAAHVRLLWKPYPLLDDAQALVLGEWRGARD
jgi:hypothetical protein